MNPARWDERRLNAETTRHDDTEVSDEVRSQAVTCGPGDPPGQSERMDATTWEGGPVSPPPTDNAAAGTSTNADEDDSGPLLGWLTWFAASVIVGMQAGTIFKSLGSIGETRIADWIDLLTPFAVLGCAVMVLYHATAGRTSGVSMFIGGVAFALGHGLHLAANSISNVDDKIVAHASIVHLWDEVASHYIWYTGLYIVLVAIWIALRVQPTRIGPAGGVLLVLFTITLVNTYIEGGVPWLGLAFLASGIVAGLTSPRSSTARLALPIGALGFLLLVGWGVAWYVADGSIFPEFSDVGWI